MAFVLFNYVVSGSFKKSHTFYGEDTDNKDESVYRCPVRGDLSPTHQTFPTVSITP